MTGMWDFGEWRIKKGSDRGMRGMRCAPYCCVRGDPESNRFSLEHLGYLKSPVCTCVSVMCVHVLLSVCLVSVWVYDINLLANDTQCLTAQCKVPFSDFLSLLPYKTCTRTHLLVDWASFSPYMCSRAGLAIWRTRHLPGGLASLLD